MSYRDEMLDEDRLFELYDILLGYVTDSEREEVAQHVYDWLRAWEASPTVFVGMSDQDKFLTTICKDKGSSDYEDEDEEDDEFQEEDNEYGNDYE